MADRPLQPTDGELEAALSRLAHQIEFPPTPDLAPAVRARIIERPRHDRRWSTWRGMPGAGPRRAVALAGLALLLVLVSVVALSPATRTAIADYLGLRGLRITSDLPPTPLATPAGDTLRLGTRLSLAEARASVPYRLLLPADPAFSTPDEVYLGYPPPSGSVALLYRARPGLPPASGTSVGLLLIQFQGQVEAGGFVKGLGPGTQLTPLTVNGGRGFWIEGEAHIFFYRDASGRIQNETIRLVGNVLIWEQGDLTLRLEGDLSRDEMLRIAGSIR